MSSLLVVCTGNVCRSPVAEGMLRLELSRRLGADAPDIPSAGTMGWEGSGAMPESIEAAAERGIDISGHVAKRVDAEMVVRADLVVCMASEHRDQLRREIPAATPRTFTLKELARLLEALPGGPTDLIGRVSDADALRVQGFLGNPADDDVGDPLGLPLDSYRAMAWELEAWCERLATGLAGPLRTPTVDPSVDPSLRGV
jgi:low molecular weight protein-tyrosine phosphatase